jgi:hypothetical protein
MADGINITPGAGAEVATDDCGVDGHTQVVKLAISSDGVATLIPATVADGLKVDVSHIFPGTAATSLGKAEDAVHASGDVGVMALAVRKDVAAALAGTDGDYIPLSTDSQGRLHIAPLPSGSQVVGQMSVTQVTPGVGATDLGKQEDAAHQSLDVGVMALAVRKDTAAAVASDGDYIPLSTDSTGRLHVNVGSIPAAARTTDSIGVAHQTDAIMNGLTALTPKFKSLTVAASQTDTSVVAAVASKKIRVLSLAHQCGGTATTATYESDEGSDVRLHKVPAGINGGQTLAFNPAGHFETAAGSALLVTTGAGSDTEITLTYVEV